MDIIRGWQRLRKRGENFRGTDINTVVMRLRPSETQCNTSESGASLYDVTRATRSFGDDKGTDSGRKRRKEMRAFSQFSGMQDSISELT